VEGDTYTGSYHAVDSGLYFLEIVVLMCDDFDPENFQQTCLVDPTHRKNIVNDDHNFSIQAHEGVYPSTIPRWRLQPNKPPVPARNRYQVIGSHVMFNGSGTSDGNQGASQDEYGTEWWHGTWVNTQRQAPGYHPWLWKPAPDHFGQDVDCCTLEQNRLCVAFWSKQQKCINGSWSNGNATGSCCETDDAMNPSSHGAELNLVQAASGEALSRYHWVGANNTRALDPAPAVVAYTKSFGKTPMVCGIGDSHTERVVASWVTYSDRKTYTQVSISDDFAQRSPFNATVFHQTYPEEGFVEGFGFVRTAMTLVEKIRQHNCTHVFVSLGQWIAGYTLGPPWTASRYGEEMQKLADDMLQLDPEKVTVAFRSLNEIPLSETVGACPPLDWRSPPVIAAYNAQLRSIAHPHFPFIDTSAIMEPMWDGSGDWNHPNGDVIKAQSDYILFHLMNISLMSQKAEAARDKMATEEEVAKTVKGGGEGSERHIDSNGGLLY
jgi:hypothetical protein